MTKIVLNNTVFRLIGPVLMGSLIYLLVLLINNSINQLITQFLSEELLVCVGIALVVFEAVRLLLIRLDKVLTDTIFIWLLVIKMLFSVLLAVVIVTTLVYGYYASFLGFTPNVQELWMFNAIFCIFAFGYALINACQQQFQKDNLKLINSESVKQKIVKEDFKEFIQELNPNFLFQCFEELISLIRNGKQLHKADHLLQHLANSYRYILSGKQKQLVEIQEEFAALKQFAELVNQLPHKKISLKMNVTSDFLCIPGSLLKIIELIINVTISTNDDSLNINIGEDKDMLMVDYVPLDKLDSEVLNVGVNELNNRYLIYSDKGIIFKNINGIRSIALPKLKPID